MEAIISAMARPASTSPPMVFKRTRMPSMSQLSSAMANCGRTCSYLVVLTFPGDCSWPSTSPIMDNRKMRCLPALAFKTTCPYSRICSSWVGLSDSLDSFSCMIGYSFFRQCVRSRIFYSLICILDVSAVSPDAVVSSVSDSVSDGSAEPDVAEEFFWI